MNKFLLSLAIGTVLTASSVVSAQNEVDRKIDRAMPANLQSLK